jgi:hypothetical protein
VKVEGWVHLPNTQKNNNNNPTTATASSQQPVSFGKLNLGGLALVTQAEWNTPAPRFKFKLASVWISDLSTVGY